MVGAVCCYMECLPPWAPYAVRVSAGGPSEPPPAGRLPGSVVPWEVAQAQGEDKRQWDIMGRGQERCSSPEQSFSEHLQTCKIPRQIYTSAAIWQLHVVFNVVSQCNMISCPELQIDRTAHTGNWLSKRNSDTSFLPSCISTVKIR